MSDTTPSILVSREGHIETLTIHNPKRKNAISNGMAKELKTAIANAIESDSRVIILKGSGRDFCAGADLDPNLLNGEPFDVTEFLESTYTPIVTGMRESNKPFIAEVHGNCVGVGFNFAMACDLVYASTDARFSQIFTKIGLSSDGGGAFFMLERMGYHKAFELMATHAFLNAEEAKQLHVVNEVIPADSLTETVNQMATRLASGPYLAIQHTKANLRAAQQGGISAALHSEAENQGVNFKSSDFMEGIMAFLQKRPAKFKGE